MQTQPTKVVGRRVGAILIDSLIVFAFNTIVFFLMAQKESEIIEDLSEGEIGLDTSLYINVDIGDEEYSIVGGGDFVLYLAITTVVGILYWMILPGLKGWTVGKLATGIRVVKDDGTCPAGVGKNVIRQLMWIADYFPYFIPYLTGFIVALTNDRNRRVGDIVAKTLVVRADAAGQPLGAAAPGFGAPAPGFGAPPGQAPGFGAQPGQAPGGPGAAPPVPSGPPPSAAAVPQAGPPAQQPAAAAPSPTPGGTPADWYPDPKGERRLRYWDGTNWTDHTAD